MVVEPETSEAGDARSGRDGRGPRGRFPPTTSGGTARAGRISELCVPESLAVGARASRPLRAFPARDASGTTRPPLDDRAPFSAATVVSLHLRSGRDARAPTTRGCARLATRGWTAGADGGGVGATHECTHRKRSPGCAGRGTVVRGLARTGARVADRSRGSAEAAARVRQSTARIRLGAALGLERPADRGPDPRDPARSRQSGRPAGVRSSPPRPDDAVSGEGLVPAVEGGARRGEAARHERLDLRRELVPQRVRGRLGSGVDAGIAGDGDGSARGARTSGLGGGDGGGVSRRRGAGGGRDRGGQGGGVRRPAGVRFWWPSSCARGTRPGTAAGAT
jgi:hypothetical protein